MKYKIYRRKKRLKVQVKYAKKPPYMFNPGYRKNKNIVDVDQIRVYNPYMINNLLLKRFVRKYKEILKMSYIIFNDENPSDSSFSVVLGEIDRLRSKLLNKYIKYLFYFKNTNHTLISRIKKNHNIKYWK